jgi:hypothetical protein
VRTRSTLAVVAVAVFAAGCSASNGDDRPRPSDPSADRPNYAADVSEEDFCPSGGEVEALESTPENTRIEIHHESTSSPAGGPASGSRTIDCPYFYIPSEDPVERITEDFATPDVELAVLDERIDPDGREVLDFADFPELPDFFQVTGWEHVGTEEEADICLSDVGLLYGECEDGQTLVKEVFALTGFHANLDVTIHVEYRYAGDPAEYGEEQAARIESHSGRIAAELLPLLLDRLPTAGE